MNKVKIFVIVGSQKFQFNRLLRELDYISKDKKYEIFAQIGYSTYYPSNYKYIDFMNRQDFNKCINDADLIITHSGTGAIINSLLAQKKVITVARLKKYDEHVDDHQLEIMEVFTVKKYLLGCINEKELLSLIEESQKMDFVKFNSNTPNFMKGLIEIINK